MPPASNVALQDGSESFFIVDPKDLRTKTIERLVAPFVALVTELQGSYFEGHKQTTGPSDLYKRCGESIRNYVMIGESAIRKVESLVTEESRNNFGALVKAVKLSGEDFMETAAAFVQNTSNVPQRIRTSEAGRILLMNVARLMIAADMLDLQQIIDKTDRVRMLIDSIANAKTEEELFEKVTIFKAELQELTELTKKRLKDMKDPAQIDDLKTSMALLKITTPIMIASSKTYIHHPELHEAKVIKDFSHNQMLQALNGVQCALNGQAVPYSVGLSHQRTLNDLAANLDRFQNHIYMDHTAYKRGDRKKLEELLETIIQDTAKIAEWPGTRETRADQIRNGNNNLRQALQELLKQYELNMGKTEADDDLEFSVDNAMHKIKDLRRHLRRAIADHVSDAFLDTRTPLAMMIAAARKGNIDETQETSEIFMQHAERMIDVARKVCDMSSDKDANSIVRYAALCCETLAPQVVNAAILLCEKPDSQVIDENMRTFENLWIDRVKLLTMAVDRMISIVDFLAVSEAHIQEDTEQAIAAILNPEGPDADTIDRSAGAIRGRSLRICEVVNAEMDTINPCPYTDNVRLATRKLNDILRNEFVQRATSIVNRIQSQGPDMAKEELDRESDEMIAACELIDNAVRDIRTAVLMNHNPEEVDSDNEYIEDGGTTALDNASQISDDGDNQQLILRKLPEESKRKIQEQIDVFNITQRKFIHEVGKWDEAGNDLITIAKQMCLMCDDMTQFTKGRGPLKRTKDVIDTAQQIATAGNRLNSLAMDIGHDCVESDTKKDLFAYIGRISTLSHQLRITSRVKADIQHVGDKLEVRGLDSVTSLIQNVKNLLNAVIHCVRSAYIASTKFRLRDGRAPRVQWVLAPPEKQPLVRPQAAHQGVIRRASERRPQQPLQALGEFRGPDF
ncbi:hypothetical protein FO519_007729 [Halicephalobus sp. NKZ332]|nr:hypothetical protein FO519_007729 [Halicephalobus sp. NKZ332]